jgi:hypothetical protein
MVGADRAKIPHYENIYNSWFCIGYYFLFKLQNPLLGSNNCIIIMAVLKHNEDLKATSSIL